MPRYGEASSYGSMDGAYEQPKSPWPGIAAAGAVGAGARSTALAIRPNVKAVESKANQRVTDAQTRLDQARDAKPKGLIFGRRNKSVNVKQATEDLANAQIRQLKTPARVAYMTSRNARLKRGGVGLGAMTLGGAYLLNQAKENQ
jgi:hypothetical protein